MTSPLDPRLHAFRADLADIALQGQVIADAFIAGQPARVTACRLPMFGVADLSGPMTNELVIGEVVDLFEQRDGVAWVQNRTDGYVGYVPAAGLAQTVVNAAWRISSLWTYVYPQPDMKTVPVDMLVMPGRVAVAEIRDDGWAHIVGGGYIRLRDIEPADTVHSDTIFTAGRLLNVPYLWGGRTALGLDCSALVQMALALAGQECPRDSDMQRARFADAIEGSWQDHAFRRGDLLFFPGHVGLMADRRTMLNADAYHMAVVCEPLEAIIARRGAPDGWGRLSRP